MSFFGASASAGASSVPSASSGCPVLRVQVAAARLRAGAGRRTWHMRQPGTREGGKAPLHLVGAGPGFLGQRPSFNH